MAALINFMKQMRRQESGVALVYLSLILIPLIGLAGLAIDSAYLVYLKARLQSTADAAALASARNLPANKTQLSSAEAADLRNIAYYYGHLNMDTDDYANVIGDQDIVFGHWQEANFTAEANFTNDQQVINAVQVTASLSPTKNNAPPLHFAQLLQTNANRLSQTSIALAQADPNHTSSNCLHLGLTALGITELGSANNFFDGTCVHGEGGIKLGSSNCAADDGPAGPALFSVPFPGGPLGNGGTDYGTNNAVKPYHQCGSGPPNNDLLAHTQSKTLLDYANGGSALLFDLAYSPGHAAHSTAVSDAINALVANGLPSGLEVQIYPTDVTINSDLTNTAIISSGKIDVTSNNSLNNVYLLAHDNVEIGSNVNLGRNDFCSNPGPEQLLIMAAKDINIGSNTRSTAVQMIAGHYLDFDSNEPLYGNTLLSGGDIKFGSNVDIHPCEAHHPVIDYGTNKANQVVASKVVY